ncbi:MAG: oxygen-dependent coproporphyrinogen oxidase [Verrucomicrobiota bacterium]|nr:oxygen-dependent coproporphyrinogen oxidase [Verrucomicrobiota bacterium]
MSDKSDRAKSMLLDLQSKIRAKLEIADKDVLLQEDEWDRSEGGGGRTWAFTEGKYLEKGGINFSDVWGTSLPKAATQDRPELAGAPFRAMGVSVVFHPFNPHIPTSHANVRFFQVNPEGEDTCWWFGGGFDLTPYYPILDDVIEWHEAARSTCDAYDKALYPKFKKWCDEYFFLPHRNETRGVGGIFFDDYVGKDFDDSLTFAEKVGRTFADSYFAIFNRRKETQFSKEQKEFQKYRRGRYVEFNLVHDRGTHFGLQSGGRTESILMSLPPEVSWNYNWSPPKGSPEIDLYSNFLRPRNWLKMKSQ